MASSNWQASIARDQAMAVPVLPGNALEAFKKHSERHNPTPATDSNPFGDDPFGAEAPAPVSAPASPGPAAQALRPC